MDGVSTDILPLLPHYMVGHFEEEDEYGAVSAFLRM